MPVVKQSFVAALESGRGGRGKGAMLTGGHTYISLSARSSCLSNRSYSRFAPPSAQMR